MPFNNIQARGAEGVEAIEALGRGQGIGAGRGQEIGEISALSRFPTVIMKTPTRILTSVTAVTIGDKITLLYPPRK